MSDETRGLALRESAEAMARVDRNRVHRILHEIVVTEGPQWLAALRHGDQGPIGNLRGMRKRLLTAVEHIVTLEVSTAHLKGVRSASTPPPIPEVNGEGLTFDEWLAAARTSEPGTLQAWLAGEDPTEWAAR